MNPMQLLRNWRWRRSVCGVRSTESGLEVDVRGYDDWLIWHEIFELGEYDASLEELCRRSLNHQAVVKVYDLGANIGLFALRLFDRWKSHGLPLQRLRVHSFEPDQANGLALCRTRERNRIPPHIWRLTQALVGELTGSGVLSRGPGHFAHSVSPPEERVGQLVPYYDLRPDFDADGTVDYLKVDIEGSEEALLTHYPCLLGNCGIVSIEAHGTRRRERVLDELRKAGFPNPEEPHPTGDGEALLTTLLASK